jgi:hypothetical protein
MKFIMMHNSFIVVNDTHQSRTCAGLEYVWKPAEACSKNEKIISCFFSSDTGVEWAPDKRLSFYSLSR